VGGAAGARAEDHIGAKVGATPGAAVNTGTGARVVSEMVR